MEILTNESFKAKIFDYENANEWAFVGDKPVIIDFFADWCGPCKMLAPVLDEVAKKYQGKVDVYKVNTEVSPDLAKAFGIRGVPSILFIPMEGQPAMASGFMPEESFDKAIEEIFGLK